MPALLTLRDRLERTWLRYAPVLLVAIAILALGKWGIVSPFTWLVVGPIAVWCFVTALLVAPLAVFWLVPLSMSWYHAMPVSPQEALVLMLAGAMGFAWLSAGERRPIHLQPVEWRYAIFLATLLPGLSVISSLWRFGTGVKIFTVGLLAFEVARHATQRFGRRAMLIGPAGLSFLTVALLAIRMRASGVPSFKGIMLRNYLTQLSWGSSNYVAAVLVLCLPATVLLVQESPRGSRLRLGAIAVLVGTLGSMFFTLSRGGFLLCVLYLLTLTRSVRRARWVLAGVAAVLAIALAATPLGQLVVSRFTNAESLSSIVARVEIWKAAWHRGVTHLPFGVGAGQGLLQFDTLGATDPHDFPLVLFTELGPLGLLAWFWLFAALWQAASRLGARADTRDAGAAMKATLGLALLNSLFEPTLSGGLYHLLFWWLAGTFHGVGAPADLPLRGVAPEAAPRESGAAA